MTTPAQASKVPYQVPQLVKIEAYNQHMQIQTGTISQPTNPFEDFKMETFFLDLDGL